MAKTTIVYDGLLNPANVIACQEGDVMEERDEAKNKLAEYEALFTRIVADFDQVKASLCELDADWIDEVRAAIKKGA